MKNKKESYAKAISYKSLVFNFVEILINIFSEYLKTMKVFKRKSFYFINVKKKFSIKAVCYVMAFLSSFWYILFCEYLEKFKQKL